MREFSLVLPKKKSFCPSIQYIASQSFRKGHHQLSFKLETENGFKCEGKSLGRQFSKDNQTQIIIQLISKAQVQMVKKIKSASCGPSWCENHLFELNPLKSGLYHRKNLRLRLCPKHNKAYNTFDKALPVLNRDNKHYTPLFILEEDKKFYSQHDERAQGNHEKLIDKEMEDQSYFSIYEPKHGDEKAYCSVCEKAYLDYMEHIKSHDHKKNLHNTIFTRYIMQIQQKFKQYPDPSNPLIADTHLTLREVPKTDRIYQKLTQEDFQTIKSISMVHKPMSTLDQLQMQQIESQFVDTDTLKEIQDIM